MKCYAEEGYVLPGYFECDIEPVSKPDLPIPFQPELPEFTEDYSDNFRGAPGVNVKYNVQQITPNKYEFVTSIVIESEKGEPNQPQYINTPKELIDTFGDVITHDMRYCMSYLSYSPSLLVQRSVGADSWNSSSSDFPLIRIDNYEDFRVIPEDEFLLDSTVRFVAQTPGKAGNKIRVSMFTKEELDNNSEIYGDYKATDIIQGMDEVCYCVVVFLENVGNIEIKEVFVVPFNDLESINTQSDYVYVRLNAYNDYLDGMYDGNKYTYSGNLVSADGDSGRYFYGYDGNLQLLDGTVGYYDGTEFSEITYIVKFYGSSIIKLETGIVSKSTFADLEESAEVLDNVLNYDIDLHIGNNVTLFRKDCVNIVGTPKGSLQAIDFKSVFDARRSTYIREKSANTFFIYGVKILDRVEMNMSADYAGLRTLEVLTNGLGISTSKISKPFNINTLKTAPSIKEIDSLYQNGINIVHNTRGNIYCNGEIMNEDNI